MRRPVAATVAIAAGVLGWPNFVADSGGSSGGCEHKPVASSRSVGLEATWRALPPGLAGGRTFASVVWTGEELIVWGGEAGSEQARRADGAAFHLGSGSWRLLPKTNLTPRSEHVAAWTGEEMIVWGGVGPDGRPARDAGAYDPTRRRWRELPGSPVEPTEFASVAWTGSRLLVWGGSRGGGVVGEPAGASYRPDTNRWRRIPSPPIAPRREAASVWTGCEFLIWGGLSTGDGGTTLDGASYDPAARRWRKLRRPPFIPSADQRFVQFSDSRMVWTGKEAILAVYLTVGADERLALAAYNPVTRRWRALPDPPLQYTPAWDGSGGAQIAWSEDRLVMTTGNLDVRGTLTLAFEPVTDQWSFVTLAPAGANYFGVMLPTAHGLIAWGQTHNALVLD